MLFERGEIVLLAFLFSSATRKTRTRRSCDEQQHRSSFDIAVNDWKRAGLLAPSWVRVHKLAAVEKRLVRRKLGRLSDADWPAAQMAILQMLG